MQDLHRRDFLKGAAASLAGASSAWPETGQRISLVIDTQDGVAAAAPVQWAAKELERVLQARRYESVGAAPANSLCIVAAGRPARDGAESMALSTSEISGRQVVLAN